MVDGAMALTRHRRRFACEVVRLEDPASAYAVAFSTDALKPSVVAKRAGELMALPEISDFIAELRIRAPRAARQNAALRTARLKRILELRRLENAPSLAELRANRLLVVDSDPSGGRVVHGFNRRDRLIDAMYQDKLLRPEQWTTATDFREAWEAAAELMPPGAVDTTKPLTSGGGQRERNESARRRYEQMVRALGPSRYSGGSNVRRRLLRARTRLMHRVVLLLVIDEQPPDEVSRANNCDAARVLRRALDRMGRGGRHFTAPQMREKKLS